jgi:hypothetical protein
MMRTKFSRILITVAAAAGLTLGGAGVANADPAGQYTYVCVSTDGSSYTVPQGAALSTCKGSYLQKYINGQHVSSVNLTTSGAIADPNAIDMDCLVAVVGTGASAYGIVQTAGAGIIAYVGLASSVYGLKSCVA